MKKIITLLLLTTCLQSFAHTYTWTGATSTYWNTASNWTGGPINTYPTVNDDVIINGTPTTPLPYYSEHLVIGSVSANFSCRSMLISNINLPTERWGFTIKNNNVSIQNCIVKDLIITETLIANGNTTLNISNVVTTSSFQISSYLHGANATINTTISGCTLKGSAITNNSNNGISNSNIIINSNTTIKGSITIAGLNANTQVINSTISNNFDGIYRSTAAIQITEKGSLTIQNSICNNANFYTTNSGSALSMLNSTLNYDSTYPVNGNVINLGDSSNINWANTDINVNANFYNGYNLTDGAGLRISMGKRQILNGNINLNYTNSNGIFLLDEFQANSGNTSKLSQNNFVDPPTINGNINIKGGSIGFSLVYVGQVFKVNGTINHIGNSVTGIPSIRTLSVPSPNNFVYGGYYYLEDVNQSWGSAIASTQRNTLILGGNTNTFIKWPTNFYMDQLVIDKQNAASVTIDSSLVIGSDLKVLNGILKLPANQNFYKLVVFDSLIINNGAAIVCSDNGANAPNILMNLDFGTMYSTNTSIIDSNTTISATTGLNLTPNTKIVFGRGNAMGLANSTNPINIDFLSTANASHNFNLLNHLNINSLVNYDSKPRFFLNNSNLTVQTPITGYSATQFIISNGSGQLRMPVGTTPVVFPIGLRPQDNNGLNYNPATITNTGTLDFFGVSVKDSVYANATAGNKIINNVVHKTWFINEAIAGGSNVTLSLGWYSNTSESQGFNRNTCYVSHYNNNAWDVVAASAATGANPYSKSRSGITSFSPFTVTSSATTLFIDNFYCSALRENNASKIFWQGTSASVKEYQIQSSSNGVNFTSISSQNTVGNNNKDYSFTHITNETIVYYRIKAISFTGEIKYSNVCKLVSTNIATMQVYPSPVKAVVNILANLKEGKTTITVFNIQGASMFTKAFTAQQGNNNTNINIGHLPIGTYVLELSNGENTQRKTIIKQ